jgi:hypothetical protein
MDKKVSGSPQKVGDPIARYLGARGIPAAKLPSDMLRELTRLLDPSTALQEAPLPEADQPEARNAAGDHRRDMLTFEMYLAAWISKEGICDKPKSRKKRAKPNGPSKFAD